MSWALLFLVIRGQCVWERDRVNINSCATCCPESGLDAIFACVRLGA